jgi:hypothetical protein
MLDLLSRLGGRINFSVIDGISLPSVRIVLLVVGEDRQQDARVLIGDRDERLVTADKLPRPTGTIRGLTAAANLGTRPLRVPLIATAKRCHY